MFNFERLSRFGKFYISFAVFFVLAFLSSGIAFAAPEYDEFDYDNFIAKANAEELRAEVRGNKKDNKIIIPPLDENLLLCAIRNDNSLENITILLSINQKTSFKNNLGQDSLFYLCMYSADNEEIITPILSRYGNKNAILRGLKTKDKTKTTAAKYMIKNKNIAAYNAIVAITGEKDKVIKVCKEALFKEEPKPPVVPNEDKDNGKDKHKESSDIDFSFVDMSSSGSSKPMYLYDYMPEPAKYIPQKGDPNQILLATIPNPNKRDSNGHTPLMTACKNGNEWEIRSLLKSGADISLADYEGWTALLYAVRYQNNLEIVNLLLSSGADINASNRYGKNALHLASSYSGNPEILKTILNQYSAGSNEIFKAFILCLSSNNTTAAVQEAKLQVFIDRNVPLNRFFEGKTPLMYAAEYCESTSILKLLIDSGAISTMRDANGKTAFDYASMNSKLSHDAIFWSLNSN